MERAPPSGIWAGSLSERRVPAEVCLRDCFGWTGAGLRLVAAGERIRQPSAEVGAGRSARAAAAAVTPRDVTAAGEGPRRRLNVAHVRGSGQGLRSQVARCVGQREVRFKSLRIRLPLLMGTSVGMPGRRTPGGRGVGSEIERGIEVGLAGRSLSREG